MRIDGGDSAFRGTVQEWRDGVKHDVHGKGLTKREWFAGLAMQGLLSAVYGSKEMLDEFTRDEAAHRRHMTGCEAVTKVALNYADALIKALAGAEGNHRLAFVEEIGPKDCEHVPVTELDSFKSSETIGPGKVGWSYWKSNKWYCYKCGVKLVASWSSEPPN